MLRVATPSAIADAVSLAGVELVRWDEGDPPDPAIEVWVPPPTHPDPGTLRSVFERLPTLEVVQLLSAGVEPWPEVVPTGITLCAGKGIHGRSTAEHAVALALAAVRELPAYGAQQREQVWAHRFTGSLVDATVMVLGAGDIGAQVGRTLAAIGADVIMVARHTRSGVIGIDQAPAMLGKVQVLVSTLPLTSDTRGLIGSRWLERLPRYAVVVNVGRGAVVDLAVLTEHVAAGRLRCALDVTEPEPLPVGHPLWSLEGAIVTPHAGGGTHGWTERAARTVSAQLRRMLAAEPLRYVVTDGY